MLSLIHGSCPLCYLNAFPTRRSSDLVWAGSLAAAVSPSELEKSVHGTMQAHEYDWRIPPAASAASKSSWIVRVADHRSEEHTSELQSRVDLVCRFLLRKKKQR